MNHLDLFSGIGGFALAAQWAGLQTVGFVEREPYCQKVLAKNFPGVEIYGDIKQFSRKDYSGTDDIFLITGGFPCQPFSCAGKRRGTADDRDLWPEMFRIIQDFRPSWVLGENVAGFVGMELDRTIVDLEREGYSVRAFVIPACAVGAPHRRDRVWIIAHANSRHSEGYPGDTIRKISEGENTEPRRGDTDAQNAAGTQCGSGAEEQRVLRTLPEDGTERNHTDRSDTAYGFGGGITTDPNKQGPQGLRQHGERRGESLAWQSGWEEPWAEVASRFCRMDARLSHRVDRLRALGNAIVPQVAYQIIKRMVMIG